MAEKKTYRPKKGHEGLRLTFPAESGMVDVTRWPYETESVAEQRFLDSQEHVTDAPEPKGKNDKKEDS